jgi:hypothetical protein
LTNNHILFIISPFSQITNQGGAPVYWHEKTLRAKKKLVANFGNCRGGQKFLPPNPLPFCPPRKLFFAKIVFKKGSNFVRYLRPD